LQKQESGGSWDENAGAGKAREYSTPIRKPDTDSVRWLSPAAPASTETCRDGVVALPAASTDLIRRATGGPDDASEGILFPCPGCMRESKVNIDVFLKGELFTCPNWRRSYEFKIEK
jgi:hypothetical protein